MERDQDQRAINDCGRNAITYVINRNAPTCIFIVARVLQFKRISRLSNGHVLVLLSRLSCFAINMIISEATSMMDGINVLLERACRMSRAERCRAQLVKNSTYFRFSEAIFMSYPCLINDGLRIATTRLLIYRFLGLILTQTYSARGLNYVEDLELCYR